MVKSPIGILLAAAGIILAVSPEARKTARKLAVKGTELLLDLNEQLKARTNGNKLENVRNWMEESQTVNLGTIHEEQPETSSLRG